MSFYDERILPHVINCACGMRAIERQRGKVVPLAGNWYGLWPKSAILRSK